jgi:hypothetical protein
MVGQDRCRNNSHDLRHTSFMENFSFGADSRSAVAGPRLCRPNETDTRNCTPTSPPKHIMSHLLDIYYSRVHPIFPFLPKSQVLNVLALASSPAHRTDEWGSDDRKKHSTFTGNLWAYGPAFAFRVRSSAKKPRGMANKIAADLWYEQS